MPESLRGRLLVATPGLVDPNFDRTVVLVLEHGDEGALGLVLNRPSEVTVGDALPEWGPLTAEPGVVFVGGPVATGTVICLARGGTAEPSGGWTPLFGDLGTVDAGRAPGDLDVRLGPGAVRVFSGYAGWGGGQLEHEVEAGGWFVVDGRPGDSHTPDPGGLWRAVLGRQRGALALFAQCPADPSTN